MSFTLQFDPSEIAELAARFGEASDDGVVAAGRAARVRGHYTRPEFLTVCRWKTARSRQKVESNSAAMIRAATRRAFATEDIGNLTTLAGVGLPTASVLMHFAFPEKFPILDVRALESFGVTGHPSHASAFWAQYVAACRTIATEHGVSLRTLDKALWQYSKETDESRSRRRSKSA